MKPTIHNRLDAADKLFRLVKEVLDRNLDKLPPEIDEYARSISSKSDAVVQWRKLLESRTEAWKLIDNLENRVDKDENVRWGSTSSPFFHVRLLGMQAYLVTNWALVDKISMAIGSITNNSNIDLNPNKGTKFVTHYLGTTENRNVKSAHTKYIRPCFGWPIAVSYAIRNHFIHEGGEVDGTTVFAGLSAASGFKISVDSWNELLKQIKNRYGLEKPLVPPNPPDWPLEAPEDLRDTLRVCERETDDALGILLVSSLQFMLAYITLMVGEV